MRVPGERFPRRYPCGVLTMTTTYTPADLARLLAAYGVTSHRVDAVSGNVGVVKDGNTHWHGWSPVDGWCLVHVEPSAR
jgi:hypothetical protein